MKNWKTKTAQGLRNQLAVSLNDQLIQDSSSVTHNYYKQITKNRDKQKIVRERERKEGKIERAKKKGFEILGKREKEKEIHKESA